MNTDDKRIREFAYEIWEAEGKPEGQEARHWEMARKLLDPEAQEHHPPAPSARTLSKPKEVAPNTASRPKADKPAASKKPRTATRATSAKTPKA